MTDVGTTLCAQEDQHLLSPHSFKGMHLMTANNELVFLPIPFILPSFLPLPPLQGPTGVSLWSKAVLCCSHLLSTHTWQQTQGLYDWAGVLVLFLT